MKKKCNCGSSAKHWANAIMVIGVWWAVAFMVYACSMPMVEKFR